jgi:hypothetical protein
MHPLALVYVLLEIATPMDICRGFQRILDSFLSIMIYFENFP